MTKPPNMPFQRTCRRMAAKMAAFAFLIVPLVSQEALAQVTVMGKTRQELDSPMSIEVPLEGFLANPAGKTWVTREMAEYHCHGITFEYLFLTQKPRKGNEPMDVEGRIFATNTGNKDQLVALEFLLVGDALSLPLASIPKWSVETDDTKFRKFSFRVPRPLLEGRATPRLRIVANIRND
jgi:hypothetical protein